mmetsp:Transcript_9815/g.13156  ORF Transcript_9815/g.13156 Transcript_9815/m.13156 type:complete len:106 (-) Transcript_9815:95-412(-)
MLEVDEETENGEELCDLWAENAERPFPNAEVAKADWFFPPAAAAIESDDIFSSNANGVSLSSVHKQVPLLLVTFSSVFRLVFGGGGVALVFTCSIVDNFQLTGQE